LSNLESKSKTAINGVWAEWDPVPPCGRIAATPQALETNAIESEPGVEPEWVSTNGIVSFGGYPLVVSDRLVGVVVTFARHIMTKPIEPDALFAAVRRWAKPRPNQAAEPKPAAETKPAAAVTDVILPEVDGIDVVGGLRRAAGNRRLYRGNGTGRWG
jgi:hypothetical protein